MNISHLIDGIVQQTTVLIAEISTAAGTRAPLSHVADQVFFDLAREIEGQGVRQKVVADMFGLALRTYQKRMRRLTAGRTDRNRTLWQAVVDHIHHEGRVTRQDVLRRFRNDSGPDVVAVLRDLVESGIVYSTGRGDSAVYGMASALDYQTLMAQARVDSVVELVWLAIHQHGPVTLSELGSHLRCDPGALAEAVERLVADGRAEWTEDRRRPPPRSHRVVRSRHVAPAAHRHLQHRVSARTGRRRLSGEPRRREVRGAVDR